MQLFFSLNPLFEWHHCPQKRGMVLSLRLHANLPWHWGTKIKGIGWAQKTGKMLPMATKVTNRPGAMRKLSILNIQIHQAHYVLSSGVKHCEPVEMEL